MRGENSVLTEPTGSSHSLSPVAGRLNNLEPNKPTSLPGQNLVEQGLAELAQDRITDLSLLVLIAAPRLRRLGLEIPERTFSAPCEHSLYARLEERLGTGAHSQYNALIRRIVSFARALEREQSSRPLES